jgi:hypothetical protein
MATPNIILERGYILLHQISESKIGITMTNNNFLFAEAVSVNDLSDKYNLGDFVLFNPLGSTLMVYDSDTYFLTTEDKIIFKEVI